MEYRWNLVELKAKRLLAKVLQKQISYQQYVDIIKQYDLSGEFDKEDFLMSDGLDSLDYKEVIKNYFVCVDNINDDLYNLCVDLFPTYCKDLKVFDKHVYNKIDFSNRDLILYVDKIIASLNIDELLRYYRWLVSHNKINIIDEDESKLYSNNGQLKGLTLRDDLFNTSYINIFRSHTIEDFETLLHEVMHAFFNYVDRNENDEPKMFFELEGEFGSYIAQDCLEKDGFQEASILKREQQEYMFYKSLFLLVNHLTILTSNNNSFDIQAAQKRINEEISPISVTLTEADLKNYFSINAYLEVSNIVSYLTSLDLLKKYCFSEAMEKIASLKKFDGYDVIENLDYHGITFHKDGLVNFTDEFNKNKKLTL